VAKYPNIVEETRDVKMKERLVAISLSSFNCEYFGVYSSLISLRPSGTDLNEKRIGKVIIVEIIAVTRPNLNMSFFY
jgi:hypothetical protein